MDRSKIWFMSSDTFITLFNIVSPLRDVAGVTTTAW